MLSGCGVTSYGWMPEISVIRLECTLCDPLARMDHSFGDGTALGSTYEARRHADRRQNGFWRRQLDLDLIIQVLTR